MALTNGAAKNAVLKSHAVLYAHTLTMIMYGSLLCYTGGAGFTFHSPFDLFREFFGGEDPFASMFGDFGGVDTD